MNESDDNTMDAKDVEGRAEVLAGAYDLHEPPQPPDKPAQRRNEQK